MSPGKCQPFCLALKHTLSSICTHSQIAHHKIQHPVATKNVYLTVIVTSTAKARAPETTAITVSAYMKM